MDCPFGSDYASRHAADDEACKRQCVSVSSALRHVLRPCAFGCGLFRVPRPTTDFYRFLSGTSSEQLNRSRQNCCDLFHLAIHFCSELALTLALETVG